eukprot:6184436-Pleurochrysis_carterae.AAC.2
MSSAGSSDWSKLGQLERAASSSSVCFLLGCCHSSGCVFASYACARAKHIHSKHASQRIRLAEVNERVCSGGDVCWR